MHVWVMYRLHPRPPAQFRWGVCTSLVAVTCEPFAVLFQRFFCHVTNKCYMRTVIYMYRVNIVQASRKREQQRSNIMRTETPRAARPARTLTAASPSQHRNFFLFPTRLGIQIRDCFRLNSNSKFVPFV